MIQDWYLEEISERQYKRIYKYKLEQVASSKCSVHLSNEKKKKTLFQSVKIQRSYKNLHSRQELIYAPVIISQRQPLTNNN